MPGKAVEKGIKKLYHYARCCPDYLMDTLTKQRVHLGNPTSFNDPWDCYPCFDTRNADDADYRARCIENLREFHLPSLSEIKRLEYEQALYQDPRFFKEMIQQFTDELRKTIPRWRIYCLTPKADVPLMWSHYSSHHRGICLEFDTNDPYFRDAYEVEYRKEFPTLDISELSSQDPAKKLSKVLLTKSSDWSYESEYRILAREGDVKAAPANYPVTKDDFLSLKPGALTAIIIGCRADVKTITDLVKRYAPNLPLKRAIQAGDSYTLSIQH